MSKIKTIFLYNLFLLLFSYNSLAIYNPVLNTEYLNHKAIHNNYLNLYNEYKSTNYRHQDVKISNNNFATRYIDWDKYTIPESKTPTEDTKTNVVDTNTESNESNWISSLWAQPFSNTAYFGMWTRHLQQRKNHIKNNKLLAVCYKGYYLGRFINSHGDITYSIGIQRSFYNDNLSIFEVEAGYRFGAMYGYKRYLRLWGTRFFPLVQLVADISLGNFVTQISWAWMVFTIGFGYKF